MGTSPDACVAAAKWEELTNRPKLSETPSVVKKKGLVDAVSLLTLACFCRVFPGTYENALPPVWFVPFPDSIDWLPVASCLSSASPQLSRCLLSPTAALSSVTSALLCHLLHLPDVLSSLLHMPATPPSTFFLPPPPPPYSNYERSCSPHTGLRRTENTAGLFSCCVAGLCLLTCCCISSRQSFHVIFHFSWEWLLAERTSLLDAILQLGCDHSLTKRHRENLTIYHLTVRLGSCVDLRILSTAWWEHALWRREADRPARAPSKQLLGGFGKMSRQWTEAFDC